MNRKLELTPKVASLCLIFFLVLVLGLIFSVRQHVEPVRYSDNQTALGYKLAKKFSKIEVYIADWCGICEHEKNYLDALDVQYLTHDIDSQDCSKRGDDKLCLCGRVPITVLIDSNGKKYYHVGFDASNPLNLLNNLEESNPCR